MIILCTQNIKHPNKHGPKSWMDTLALKAPLKSANTWLLLGLAVPRLAGYKSTVM